MERVEGKAGEGGGGEPSRGRESGKDSLEMNRNGCCMDFDCTDGVIYHLSSIASQHERTSNMDKFAVVGMALGADMVTICL